MGYRKVWLILSLFIAGTLWAQKGTDVNIMEPRSTAANGEGGYILNNDEYAASQIQETFKQLNVILKGKVKIKNTDKGQIIQLKCLWEKPYILDIEELSADDLAKLNSMNNHKVVVEGLKQAGKVIKVKSFEVN